jgi:hypothetical protein
MNLSELATGLFFISLIGYFGYDGFKQIFAKPEPCELPREHTRVPLPPKLLYLTKGQFCHRLLVGK